MQRMELMPRMRALAGRSLNTDPQLLGVAVHPSDPPHPAFSEPNLRLSARQGSQAGCVS